jgi:hypothetical protein
MGMAIEGKSKIVSATPTLDTNIYASGDRVGSVMTFSSAMDDSSGTGTVVSVVILDKAAQGSALSLLLFNDLPTVASADNAALDISDTEMEKCVGVIPIASGDYVTATSGSVATVRSVNLLLNSAKSANNLTGTNLYGVLKSGGTPTYAASSLIVKVCIKQD